jgi:hypothetical protein
MRSRDWSKLALCPRVTIANAIDPSSANTGAAMPLIPGMKLLVAA